MSGHMLTVISPGCHHSARRLVNESPPILLRPGRRHRALPIESHPPHGEEENGKEVEG